MLKTETNTPAMEKRTRHTVLTFNRCREERTSNA
jgi:hypothetical protein